jgi:uncharacterized OB-fold protein
LVLSGYKEKIKMENVPGNWRTRLQRYRLRAEVCNDCNNVIFPPRDVCPFCAEIKRSENNRITFVDGSMEIQSRNEVVQA